MRALLVATQLVAAAAVVPEAPPGVIAAHLRGSPAVDERGERGHFYYATKCEDCFYKGDECGCQPAVEYFACLTKHCHDADHPSFMEKCGKVGNTCSADLDIDCSGSETVCRSKWNQLPTGGLGLSVNMDMDSAFCGPFGKCLGKIHINVDVHNRPKPPVAKPPVVAASPAPAAASSPGAAAIPAVPVPPPTPVAPVWLECGISKASKGNVDVAQDWKLCQVEAKGDTASCTMPRFKELKVGSQKQSYCVLTEGKNGKRLTTPSFSVVVNTHKAVGAEVKKVDKVETKQKDEKPEAPKEVEAEKVEAPKEVKAPKEVEAKKVEAPKEAHVVQADSDKFPWMVEKEKREAARAAEEKSAPAEPEKKKEEAANYGEDKSELPWMKGKVMDKPAPPGVIQ